MGIRFGWSAIWGLIPEIGDVFDLFFAWHLMHRCGKVQGGLPTDIHMRMILNVVLDFLVGLIPVIGDLADAAFRCNTKNAALLEDYLMKKHGPKNMSIKEKRQSRLENFSDERINTLRDAEKDQSPNDPRRPQPAHPGKEASKGRWFSGDRRREPDVEMGRQNTGRTS